MLDCFFYAASNGVLCWNIFWATDYLDVSYEAALDEVFWLVILDLRVGAGGLCFCNKEEAF